MTRIIQYALGINTNQEGYLIYLQNVLCAEYIMYQFLGSLKTSWKTPLSDCMLVFQFPEVPVC